MSPNFDLRHSFYFKLENLKNSEKKLPEKILDDITKKNSRA